MDISFKPGDEVILRMAKQELACTILESYDQGVVLVKLESGYNIGIPKEHIFDYKIVKKYSGKKEVKKQVKEVKQGIGLIVTGGTIASTVDYKTGGVRPLDSLEDFQEYYPSLFNEFDIKKVSKPFLKLSEDINSDNWQVLAEEIKKMLDDKNINGIIISHGTDTLHYTSAAMAFFLKVNKPVVFTYAQRSVDRPSSDAELNLRCAARFALSNCAQVVVVGHAGMNDDFCYAFNATKLRKLHSSRRDAFKPVNCIPIARISDKVEFLTSYNAASDIKPEIDSSFSKKIALVKVYPGQDPEILEHYFAQGYRGVVLEVFGIGNLPESWAGMIKKIVKQGMIVCAASQTIFGRLHPEVYASGRELEKSGLIFLRDMLAETAFVKLGWVLGHRHWKGKEKEKMLNNFTGEFNELLTE